MTRRDIMDIYKHIEELKDQLIDLERTPFKCGWNVLIECTKKSIEFNKKKIIEAEKIYKFERTGIIDV